MTNKILIVLAVLMTYSNLSIGQNFEAYKEIVGQAEELYDAKNFIASATKYKEAFDSLGGKAVPNDRYNAACSYALAADTSNAFYHLYYLAEHPNILYKDYEHISTDTDLENLYPYERWESVLEIVKKNKYEFEKDLDKPLMAKLDSINVLDQKYRIQLDEIEEKYGRDSEEIKAQWKLIRETDSTNLITVKEILDTRGWLGKNVVGRTGNSTLFLVIQHSDLETQQKYLPMMREAVKAGNASGSSLALLEDRVALGLGKRQIYGSQIGRDSDTGEYYVSPLIDPENVNERRASVGLGPLENYTKHWDFAWDIEKHKANTAKIEAAKQEVIKDKK